MNLQQRLCLRIFGLTELLDLPVVLLYLDCYLRDLLEHWTERLCQPWWHNSEAALSEAGGGGSRHTVAAGLRQTHARRSPQPSSAVPLEPALGSV